MSDRQAHSERATYGTGRRAELVRRRAAQLGNVLPHDEAVAQAKWELNRAIARALDGGASRVEIAHFFGLTPPRIGHYKNRARRRITPPLLRYPTLSPRNARPPR